MQAKIGMVGGMTWLSTVNYYELINKGISSKLGGLHAATCLIYAVDFAELYHKTWPHAYPILLEACMTLKNAGVEVLVLCANTAHLYVEKLKADTGLPFIDIGIETAKAIHTKQLKTVGLLGTKFTMEMDFIKDKFVNAGIQVIVPDDEQDRNYMQESIVNELAKGIFNESTRKNYQIIIDKLIKRGAEGIVLGCTEIPLIIAQKDVTVPVFDTTQIHADAIVAQAIALKTRHL